MKYRSIMTLTAAFSILCGAACAGSLSAKYNNFAMPINPTAKAIPPFIDEVAKETEGTLNIKAFYGGSLFGAKESLAGVKGGGSEMGYLVLGYYPAAFRYGTLLSNLEMVGSEPLAVAAAASELQYLHCEPCQQEFERQNIVYFGSHATSIYSLISKEPLTHIDDLKEKKIRTAGSVWDRWLTSVGATPVNIPTSEIFDAFSRGILDGAILAPGSLRSESLWDVAKNLTEGPLGTYPATILVAVNRDFNRKMTTEQRSAVAYAAAKAIFMATDGYRIVDEEVLAELGDHGVSRQRFAVDTIKNFKEFNEGDIKTMADFGEDRLGIDDAETIIDKYTGLYLKWEKKLRDAEALHDPDKASEIFERDVLSKIDFTKYGL